MKLRPYQQAAIVAVFEHWKSGGKNPLIVLPTASGKTIVFATMIKMVLEKYAGTRVMILAHTKELIEQAEEKLLSVWPGAPVGVYAASLKRRQWNTITIASRDTIKNVIHDAGVFDLVFIDEAHLIAPSETSGYMKIISALRAVNPYLNVIGFTATPFRTGTGYIYGTDEKHIFEKPTYEAKIAELMSQGYLCPITAKKVNSQSVADTSQIKTTAGDFNKGDLQDAMIDENIIKTSLDEWQNLAFDKGRKSSVFFCVSILHAELVSQELLKRGHDAPVIKGATPSAERAEILQEFDAGNLIGVVNVGCLTTGWDSPRLDCIVMLRPTKSLGLFLQMVGRGLRLHESKQNTLLLDFGECLKRFGPIDIAKPVARKGVSDERTKDCPECESIVGIFKQKCPDCGFEFKPPAHKICKKCNTENAPRAAKCGACDEPFFKHENHASDLAVMSSDIKPDLQTFPIQSVTLGKARARTGRDYLRVTYTQNFLNHYTKNLMIGYPGYAGEKAEKEWRAMTASDAPTPNTPELACGWFDSEPSILKAVESITVNMNSKYRDIEKINYKGAQQ